VDDFDLRRLDRAAAELADQQTEQVEHAADSGMRVATVTDVVPEGAGDGIRPLIKVTYGGGETTAAGYADGLVLNPGDRVRCSLVDRQLFIDYRIVGQP
jgi:hypothetical protein